MKESLGVLDEKIRKAKSPWIVLLHASAEKFSEVNEATLSLLAKHGYRSIYVSLNKPSDSIILDLRGKGFDVSKLFFVDCVPIKADARRGDTVFLKDAKNLADISLAVDSLSSRIESGKKFLIIDSVPALLLHHSPEAVAKYMQFLVSKMRAEGLSGAMLSVEKETHPELLEAVKKLCDELVMIT